jgi:hypothetical protein
VHELCRINFAPYPAVAMNAEIYAEWLRRQGHRIVRSASSYWHSEGMRIFQAFPHHWLIEPSERELRELTSSHGALALRYSMPANMPSNMPANMPPKMGPGTGSYHTVCTTLDYGFESMGAKTRHNTRRALRECTVGPISFDRYEEEGWELRVDTLARQQRRLHESKNEWRRRCRAAVDLEGFEVWAAEVEGRLAATLLIFRMHDWYYLLYQQCHRSYLSKHVNNALTFSVTATVFQRPGVQGIYYGMRSLDAPASVDEFKFHMGYQRRPVRQRIVFHPAAIPFVNRFSLKLLTLARRFSPRQRWLAKAQAMFGVSLAEKCVASPGQSLACERVAE